MSTNSFAKANLVLIVPYLVNSLNIGTFYDANLSSFAFTLSRNPFDFILPSISSFQAPGE